MPELPEVETVRTGLAPHMKGNRIATTIRHRSDLRYPMPDFEPLEGCIITAVRRRAKYLLFELDNGQTLVWHLGMTGQFHWLTQDAASTRHEHVRIDFEDGGSLRYRDPRRFGYCGLIETVVLNHHTWFASLGPEPLSAAFDGDHLIAACAGRKTAIKSIIMDNAVVVGVGNIYASESLFRAGIQPHRAAGRISRKRLESLSDYIKDVLQEAIAAGGSTISDFVAADGKPGYFAHVFRVYGRKDEPCRFCGTPIKQSTIAGRSTFHCPRCQR